MPSPSALANRRQRHLDALAKACKHHRGVRQARQAAERATHTLLQAEVTAQDRQRRAAAKQARRDALPDLFQEALQ